MKQLLDDQALQDMTVPTVRPSHHQARLRRMLVSRAAKRAAGKQPIIKGVSIMNKRNVFAGIGVATALTIAVCTFTLLPSGSAGAMRLAQDSATALAKMDPQDDEYKKFYPYFVDWMQQAQKAPDLRVLSYDELVKLYPGTAEAHPASGEPLRVIDNPSDGRRPNVRELKYLAFSAKDGDTEMTIVVGVNSDNIPEAAVMNIDKDGTHPRANG
jgi:hypothetical protein